MIIVNYCLLEFLFFATVIFYLLWVICKLIQKTKQAEIDNQTSEKVRKDEITNLEAEKVALARKREQLEVQLRYFQDICLQYDAKITKLEAQNQKLEADGIKARHELSKHKRNLEKLLQALDEDKALL